MPRRIAVAALVGLVPLLARAHEFTITDVLAVLKSDGTYQVDIRLDVDALALGVSASTDSAQVLAALQALDASALAERIDAARGTLQRRVRIRLDGEKQRPDVAFPEYATPLAAAHDPPTLLGLTARLTGPIPPHAKAFEIGLSRTFPAVNLTIFDQSALRSARQTLAAGEDSAPFAIGAAVDDDEHASARRTRLPWRYLLIGFEHILPAGLDHILFVLGLFLLSRELKPLLWQVTAFTVAHSITLGLSMYDVVALPSQLVETLIALSIAYVGIENVATTKLHAWRVLLVFAFGLLHGLGFAGALSELGLPREQYLSALVFFNLGVEFGQVTVILLALLVVGWFRSWRGYRRWAVVPLSVGIAVLGLYWAVERGLGVELGLI